MSLTSEIKRHFGKGDENAPGIILEDIQKIYKDIEEENKSECLTDIEKVCLDLNEGYMDETSEGIVIEAIKNLSFYQSNAWFRKAFTKLLSFLEEDYYLRTDEMRHVLDSGWASNESYAFAEDSKADSFVQKLLPDIVEDYYLGVTIADILKGDFYKEISGNGAAEKEYFEGKNLGINNFEKDNLEKDNLGRENLGKENLEWENLGKENLGKENLEWKNLGSKNVEKENLSKKKSGRENTTKENFPLENIGKRDPGNGKSDKEFLYKERYLELLELMLKARIDRFYLGRYILTKRDCLDLIRNNYHYLYKVLEKEFLEIKKNPGNYEKELKKEILELSNIVAKERNANSNLNMESLHKSLLDTYYKNLIAEYPSKKDTINAEKLSWQNVRCNDLCPCKSGKKFKKCHGA